MFINFISGGLDISKVLHIILHQSSLRRRRNRQHAPDHAGYQHHEQHVLENGTDGLRSLNTFKESKLDCTMQQTLMQYEDSEEEEYWECFDEITGRFYDLNYKFESDYKDPRIGRIVSGMTTLHSDKAIMISEEKVAISDEPQFRQKMPISDYSRRLRMTGTKEVLVVRVDARDTKTGPTEEVLAREVFGIEDSNGNTDSWNLSSAFDQCSNGKMKFQPTNDSKNGVYSVSLNESILDKKHTDVRTKVLQKLSNDFGISDLNTVYDHVIICLPPGLKTNSGMWYFGVPGCLAGILPPH